MKKLISLLVFAFLFMGMVSGAVINERGDFSIGLDKERYEVYKKDMKVSGNFTVRNNLNEPQVINLSVGDVRGWEIELNSRSLYLEADEEARVRFEMEPNNEFNYQMNVRTDDFIKISQEESYLGSYRFPYQVNGANENLSFSVEVFVNKENRPLENFNVVFYDDKVVPGEDFKFAVVGEHLNESKEVTVKFNMYNDSEVFKKVYTPNHYVNFFTPKIENLAPGNYNVNVSVSFPKEEGRSVWQWFFGQEILVLPHKELKVDKDESSNLFVRKYLYSVNNTGNVESVYEDKVNLSFMEYLVLRSSLGDGKLSHEDGILSLEKNIGKGEEVEFGVSVNYWIIYLVVVCVLSLGLAYYLRVNSNPLAVNNKIYDIVRDPNEGIKSLKVRIEFENIKEKEIEDLKIIFRMPSYLNIKESSFTLVEPKQALKSKHEYKLVWEFKRFEKGESRILGFTLVNKKGILGDIRLPDLEAQIKTNGKLRRYYKSFRPIKN